MKFTAPKFNSLKSLLKLKYLYLAVSIVALALFSYLGFFLYQYLYQTIAQSGKIILLKTEVAPDTVDMKDVDVIIELINKKSAPKDINRNDIKNPFLPLAAEPSLPQPKTATTTSK